MNFFCTDFIGHWGQIFPQAKLLNVSDQLDRTIDHQFQGNSFALGKGAVNRRVDVKQPVTGFQAGCQAALYPGKRILKRKLLKRV